VLTHSGGLVRFYDKSSALALLERVMDLSEYLRGVHLVTVGLARIIAWLMFAVIHLALMVLALTLLWWFQVSPDAFQETVTSLLHSKFQSSIAGILAFLGISVSAAAYLKGWRYLMRKFVTFYIFSR
jgi:hypothetical protein